MSQLAVGAGVWIPCKVKPGPFTNERVVIVDAADNNWVGFVSVNWLHRGVERGSDQVLAKVTEVRESEGVFSHPFPAAHRVPRSSQDPSTTWPPTMILSKPYIIKELERLAGNGLPDGAAVDRHASRRLRLRTMESRRASSASDGACKGLDHCTCFADVEDQIGIQTERPSDVSRS